MEFIELYTTTYGVWVPTFRGVLEHGVVQYNCNVGRMACPIWANRYLVLNIGQLIYIRLNMNTLPEDIQNTIYKYKHQL